MKTVNVKRGSTNGLCRAFVGRCRQHASKSFFAVAVFLWAVQPLPAIYVIDSFDTLQSTNVTFGPPPYKFAFTSVLASEAVGGERDISLERLSGTGAFKVDVGGNTNYFTFNSPTSPNYGRAMISWDGIDGSTATNFTGLSGVDLTQSGTNFHFLVRTGSDDGAAMTVTVYSDAANYSQYTYNVPSGTLSTLTNALFAFADFTIVGGSGANFANVGAVTLGIDNTLTPGADVALELFMAIPEPSSAALWLLGAGGLAMRRRRWRS
jgi:hypothetical protein